MSRWLHCKHKGCTCESAGQLPAARANVPVPSQLAYVHVILMPTTSENVQEEEAARLAEEEEARRAEDAERRKAERLARRAEAKRQGLILTGKAKREAERLAAMREQILKNAAALDGGAAANGALLSVHALCSSAWSTAHTPTLACPLQSTLAPMHPTCCPTSCSRMFQGAVSCYRSHQVLRRHARL